MFYRWFRDSVVKKWGFWMRDSICRLMHDGESKELACVRSTGHCMLVRQSCEEITVGYCTRRSPWHSLAQWSRVFLQSPWLCWHSSYRVSLPLILASRAYYFTLFLSETTYLSLSRDISLLENDLNHWHTHAIKGIMQLSIKDKIVVTDHSLVSHSFLQLQV